MEEYRVLLADPTRGDHERFMDVKQPVYIQGNVYLGGATPFEGEKGATVLEGDVSVRIVDEGGEVFLETQLPDGFAAVVTDVVGAADLTPVRFVDADFENPDGSSVVADTDLTGNRKTAGRTYPAGPLATLTAGSGRVRVW